MKHICATLLLLCNTLNGELDLDFIEEVKACALQHNAIVESPERIPINLVLAQAILESDWGKSRFATNGNNLFGIKAVNGEDYMKSRNGKTCMRSWSGNIKPLSKHKYIGRRTPSPREFRLSILRAEIQFK